MQGSFEGALVAARAASLPVPATISSFQLLNTVEQFAARFASPARVKRIDADTLEITIHEGRKRQVKQMCERVGHPVKQLQRIRFGPLELGGLRPGQWRRLSTREIDALANAGSAARRSEASSPAAPPKRRRG